MSIELLEKTKVEIDEARQYRDYLHFESALPQTKSSQREEVGPEEHKWRKSSGKERGIGI